MPQVWASPVTSPKRHWRSYGDQPLPSGAEALNEPFRAFPSWFLRIECDRCGMVRMLNEAHVTPGSGTCGYATSSPAPAMKAAAAGPRRRSC